MSESKHTPGPWTFDGDVVTGMDSRSRFAGTPSNDIFDVNEWPEELLEEGIANARLIAAAPDLLAALKRAVELYGKPGGPWNVPSEPGSWLTQARAAIAAAEEVR